MYESFYGLTEKPFTLLPDPDYLYFSPKHQRALTLLEYGMMNQAGFSVICGDTGAGKTTLLRRLLSELGDDTKVGLITNTHSSFGELLNWVLMAFGLDGENKSKAQMHQMFIDFLIEQYAKNKRTVLIVDEAQNMKADTLEELRMLSNINADKDQVLQVILAGQPALRETLRKPELMQFAQRIAVDYYLEALSAEETNAYIHHRLKVAGADSKIFEDDACDAVFKYSGGTPRLINLLCDTSLVYGFAEQSKIINANLIHDVVREQHSNSIIPTFNTDYSEANFAASEMKPEQKVCEESTDYQQLEEEPATASEVDQDQTIETVSELMQQAANASAVSAHESPVSVSPSEKLSGIEGVKTKSVSTVSEEVEVAPKEELEHESSNITPIKSKTSTSEASEDIPSEKPEEKNQASNPQAEEGITQETEGEENTSSDDLENNISEVDENEVKEAPHMSQKHRRSEDVYPIVHIEDSPKKGMNMMLVGLVGGMFIASIIMFGAAWMILGSMNENAQQIEQPNSNKQVQQLENERALRVLQQERDAALAVTRALEGERDAALTAAKVQEEIRAAELRAAEILAKQERRAEKKLRQARARIREAEKAESNALAREQKLKDQAQKRDEAEQLRLENLRKERALLEAKAIEEQKMRTKLLQQQEDLLKGPIKEEVKDVPAPKKTVKTKVKKDEGRFSSNPCNSPSAKFLSTCKK